MMFGFGRRDSTELFGQPAASTDGNENSNSTNNAESESPTPPRQPAPASPTPAAAAAQAAAGNNTNKTPKPKAVPNANGGNESAPAQPINMEAVRMYLIDESLSFAERVERYAQSQLPLQRLVYVNQIADCAKEVGEQVAVEKLFPLLTGIAQDHERIIRQALAAQLGQLAQVVAPALEDDSTASQQQQRQQQQHDNDDNDDDDAKKQPVLRRSASSNATRDFKPRAFKPRRVRKGIGYGQIRNVIVPCLEKLLADDVVEVRLSASRAVVAVAKVMDSEDVGSVILTLVLSMAHDEADDVRMTAVGVLHDLARVLDPQLIQNFVALEMKSFADDPSFRVRKAAALCFGTVVMTMAPDVVVAKLLPPYLKLCSDRIWGVRKGCVESIVAFTQVVPPIERAQQMVPLFERFIADQSRWVRNCAYEVLGRFIYALGSNLLTQELLEHYVEVPNLSDSVVDADVAYSCAFSFPAVAMTLGPDRFEEILPTLRALSKHTKFNVRRTLSHSLYEIAAIIGPALSARYLAGLFELFLRDLDEVRMGAINTISRFLAALPESFRGNFLAHVWSVVRQSEAVKVWRYRHSLAAQLADLAHVLPRDVVVTQLVPLARRFAEDKVAVVRDQASLHIGQLMLRVLPTTADASFVDLCNWYAQFARHRRFRQRRSFVVMSLGIFNAVVRSVDDDDDGNGGDNEASASSSANVDKEGWFAHLCVPGLELLRTDKVVGVRMAVARFVVAFLQDWKDADARSRALVDAVLNDKDEAIARVIAEGPASARAALLGGVVNEEKFTMPVPGLPWHARDEAQRDAELRWRATRPHGHSVRDVGASDATLLPSAKEMAYLCERIWNKSSDATSASSTTPNDTSSSSSSSSSTPASATEGSQGDESTATAPEAYADARFGVASTDTTSTSDSAES
eukprot:TRINITY_DN65877_c14_g1_i1.p1 TRINITY_DN65877_c14_g1~~TRINITY_DN65877_c14_g1_i1.p1  ORF type:complete len:913 (+),score=448.99 TRINITY_DN65877_c14_g1_i1:27-2765(+)